MKIIALSMLLALSLISCNKKSEIEAGESPVDTKVDAAEKLSETEKQCYEFVQQKDTISMSFDQTANTVNGDLSFKNFEKDSSHGAIKGMFSGDTLKLTYVFQSEGVESTREINFLKKGLSLQMGTGDMEDKDGKMMFKNPSAIKYTNATVLVKTQCKN